MEKGKRADMEFSLEYRSSCGSHVDRYYLERVDYWRDLFPGPGTMADALERLAPGEQYREQFAPGVLVPAFSVKNTYEMKLSEFSSEKNVSSADFAPRPGGFYPKGYGWRQLI